MEKPGQARRVLRPRTCRCSSRPAAAPTPEGRVKDASLANMHDESPFSVRFVLAMGGVVVMLVVIIILGYRATKVEQLHDEVKVLRDAVKGNHRDIQRLEGVPMTPENWHYLIETIGVMVLSWIAYKQHQDSRPAQGSSKPRATTTGLGDGRDPPDEQLEAPGLAEQGQRDPHRQGSASSRWPAAGVNQERDRAADIAGGPDR